MATRSFILNTEHWILNTQPGRSVFSLQCSVFSSIRSGHVEHQNCSQWACVRSTHEHNSAGGRSKTGNAEPASIHHGGLRNHFQILRADDKCHSHGCNHYPPEHTSN